MISTKIRIYFQFSAFYVLFMSTLGAQELSRSNFIAVSDNVYISRFEVSNKEYNEFLLRYTGPHEDSIKIYDDYWVKGEFDKSYNIPYSLYYSSSEKYIHHPVVNITQFGAKEYCRWLSENYSRDSFPSQAIVFRLPTQKEWMEIFKKHKAAIDINGEKLTIPKDLPQLTQEQKDSITQRQVKKLRESPEKFQALSEYYKSDLFIERFSTQPVDYVILSPAPVFNMLGNVSEWTEDDNLAIGGNWLNKTTQSKKELTSTFKSTSPSPKIGFRIVMVVDPS